MLIYTKDSDEHEYVIKNFVCEHCNAPIGESCKTPKGKKRDPHEVRYDCMRPEDWKKIPTSVMDFRYIVK